MNSKLIQYEEQDEKMELNNYVIEIAIAKHVIKYADRIGWVLKTEYTLESRDFIYVPQQNDIDFVLRISYKHNSMQIIYSTITVGAECVNRFIKYDPVELRRRIDIAIKNKVTGFIPLQEKRTVSPQQEEIYEICEILRRSKDLQWEDVSNEYSPEWQESYRYDKLTVSFRKPKTMKSITDYQVQYGSHIYSQPRFMLVYQVYYDIRYSKRMQKGLKKQKKQTVAPISTNSSPESIIETDRFLNRIITAPGNLLWDYKKMSYGTFFEGHLNDKTSVVVYINHVIENDSKIVLNGIKYKPPYFSPKALEDKLLKLIPKEPDENPEKTEHPSEITINIKDFVIRCRTFKCTKADHKIENIKASVPVVLKDGKQKDFTVTAGHCLQCGTYFIMESTYLNLKQHGLIMCRVYDEKSYQKYISVNGMKLAVESKLKQYGYNVSEQEGLTERQRRMILANLIDNSVFSKTEIISHIDFCIAMHQNDRFIRSVSRRKDDRDFVENYWPGSVKKYGVNAIYRS